MFGLDDLFVFFRTFFIMFPIVTLIHVLGHYLFARIYGCHDVKLIIGCGAKLFSIRFIEVRTCYFWYGGCEFSLINETNRFHHLLIYFGGSLFNMMSIIMIHILIKVNIIDASTITYQFIYFSIYTIFFALLPMDYPDGNPSDGKVIYHIFRKRRVHQSTDCKFK
jgi:hypothetical protein